MPKSKNHPANVENTDHHPDQKNYDFVQLRRMFMRDWRTLTKESPVAVQIMFYFMEYMNTKQNIVVCSYKTLQEVTGYSRASVSRGIKTLKDKNWIDTVRVGSATAYAINERIVWGSTFANRRYAVFSATCIAAESDQVDGKINENPAPIRHVPISAVKGSAPILVDENEELPPPDQKDLDLF